MKIKHLRKWLSILPTDYDEFDLVYRTIVEVDQTNEDSFVVKDELISSCGIDDDNSESYFTNEESHIKIKNQWGI